VADGDHQVARLQVADLRAARLQAGHPLVGGDRRVVRLQAGAGVPRAARLRAADGDLRVALLQVDRRVAECQAAGDLRAALLRAALLQAAHLRAARLQAGPQVGPRAAGDLRAAHHQADGALREDLQAAHLRVDGVVLPRAATALRQAATAGHPGLVTPAAAIHRAGARMRALRLRVAARATFSRLAMR